MRQFRPCERLILLGGGHIALSLYQLGLMLAFSVTVVDDRPEYANHTRFPEAVTICDSFPAAIAKLGLTDRDYVAVITHGHRSDSECLRTILAGTMPYYLGMIGSRRRVKTLLTLLEQEGFDPGKLKAIHSPIGLAIGALTPQEIAVSIAGELIQCRRSGKERIGSSGVLQAEDVDLALLRFLAHNTVPMALLVVVDSEGSTPAKPGAIMAVDRNFQTAGTIGGGCGEHIALRKAWQLIGTGRSDCITVDMTEDVKLGDMACGGRLTVYLTDIEMEE